MEGTHQPRSSPLDPVMHEFLRQVQATPAGFAPGAQSAEVATAMDVPDALIDAVFVSARTRGLIQPDFNARGRRRRWIVSARGHDFLAEQPGPASDHSAGGDANGH